MTTRTDFRSGDSVRHMNGDTGRVTFITESGEVCVTLADKRTKDSYRGQYDEDWFRKYPNGLVKLDDGESQHGKSM